MVDETVMRAAMQEYIDAFNRDDLAGLVNLYADDATVEDPVGSEPKTGRAEIEAFYKVAVASGARLKLSAPIRASHGNSAAMAFDVSLHYQGRDLVISAIDVMTFNDEGKYSSMKAYWGPGDMREA